MPEVGIHLQNITNSVRKDNLRDDYDLEVLGMTRLLDNPRQETLACQAASAFVMQLFLKQGRWVAAAEVILEIAELELGSDE